MDQMERRDLIISLIGLLVLIVLIVVSIFHYRELGTLFTYLFVGVLVVILTRHVPRYRTMLEKHHVDHVRHEVPSVVLPVLRDVRTRLVSEMVLVIIIFVFLIMFTASTFERNMESETRDMDPRESKEFVIKDMLDLKSKVDINMRSNRECDFYLLDYDEYARLPPNFPNDNVTVAPYDYRSFQFDGSDYGTEAEMEFRFRFFVDKDRASLYVMTPENYAKYKEDREAQRDTNFSKITLHDFPYVKFKDETLNLSTHTYWFVIENPGAKEIRASLHIFRLPKGLLVERSTTSIDTEIQLEGGRYIFLFFKSDVSEALDYYKLEVKIQVDQYVELASLRFYTIVLFILELCLLIAELAMVQRSVQHAENRRDRYQHLRPHPIRYEKLPPGTRKEDVMRFRRALQKGNVIVFGDIEKKETISREVARSVGGKRINANLRVVDNFTVLSRTLTAKGMIDDPFYRGPVWAQETMEENDRPHILIVKDVNAGNLSRLYSRMIHKWKQFGSDPNVHIILVSDIPTLPHVRLASPEVLNFFRAVPLNEERESDMRDLLKRIRGI